jgi:F-type H+-transporting ATPase subunit c
MKKRMLLVMLGVAALALAVPALAQEPGAAGAAAGAVWRDVGKFAAAAFAIGFAAFAGAFGQARAVASACTSMGRNPGAAGPVRITLLLGLAFIESLVIYSLVISFIILGK